MSFFNQQTQTYIDNALNTLQIWFGTGGQAGQGGSQIPPNQGGSGVQVPPRYYPPRQTEENKDKTLTYVAIGAGVILVGLTTFLIIKKRKQ